MSSNISSLTLARDTNACPGGPWLRAGFRGFFEHGMKV